MIIDKQSYDKDHAWQYEIRKQNLKIDLKEAEITNEEVEELKVSDFTFSFLPKENKEECEEVVKFIERHEWLGKMPNRPTHRFVARYKGKLAGAVIMATPNAFSHLLGEENMQREKLISRGACISWSPKNLGSALIMYAVRWMAKNTEFCFFTAYSDIEARELGTIYQACNFLYLGQESGARFEYFDERAPDRGWFSDRIFRKTSSYKNYAKNLSIEWQPDWIENDRIAWERIPLDLRHKMKQAAKEHQLSCQKRPIPKKHKYVYILGSSKSETKKMKNIFHSLNPEIKKYPKVRGPQKLSAPKERKGPLTKIQNIHRPTGRYRSVKDVSKVYGISIWTIYELIKSDPHFPYRNIGLKKKLVVDVEAMEAWLTERTKRDRQIEMQVPSAEELLTKRRIYA